MTDAMINEKVLAWAVDRAEIPLDVVARKVNVKPERIATWIVGEERPTFRQAQSLSSVLHIPFGYLFLKEPPELGDANYGVHQKIERKCNEIAAEFLIPGAGFPAQWRGADSLSDNADRLSRVYKVSRIVIVRRALDLGLIDQASYSSFYASEVARWSDTPASEGGSFHNNLPLRNGLRFTRTVVNQAVSGGLLLRHAASLLNAQPTAILSYHKNGRLAQ